MKKHPAKNLFHFWFLAPIFFLTTALALGADPNPEATDPYERLGLARKVLTEGEIKKAYRAAVKTYHPDKVTEPALKEKYTRYFQNLNDAYEALLKKAGTPPVSAAQESARSSSPRAPWDPPEKEEIEIISRKDIRYRLEQIRGGDRSLNNLISSIRTLHIEFLRYSSQKQFIELRYAVALTSFEEFPDHLRDVKTLPELQILLNHVDLARSKPGEYSADLKQTQVIEIFDKAIELSRKGGSPTSASLAFLRTALEVPNLRDKYAYPEFLSDYLTKLSDVMKLERSEIIQRAYAPLYLSKLDVRKMNRTWTVALEKSNSLKRLERLTRINEILRKIDDPVLNRFLRSVNLQLSDLATHLKITPKVSRELYNAVSRASQASFNQRWHKEPPTDLISWKPGDGLGHSAIDCIRLFFSLR